MNKFAEWVSNIYAWGEARNITREGGATVTSQISKAREEIIELTWAMAETPANLEAIQDAIGDIVVCYIQALRLFGRRKEWVITRLEEVEGSGDRDTWNSDLALCQALLTASEDRRVHIAFICVLNLLNDICIDRNLSWSICLAKAWNQIKDRKGKMVAGKFVKES